MASLPVDALARYDALTLTERAEADRLLAIPTNFRDFVTESDPTFRWFRAQELIAGALEMVAAGTLRRLMIFMPPQEGKSQLVTRLFPAYFLTQHPDRWVGVGSYGFGLAKTFSRAARGFYRGIVTETSGDESSAVDLWETGAGGGLWAVGRGGSATGRPAHLLIVDDPLKDREEADSETIRASLHAWYGGVLNMRLQPENAVVIVHTRWHEDDLSGHLLELERGGERPEGWHVIELPGIAEGKADRPVYPPTVKVAEDWRKPGEPLAGRYAASRYEQIRVVSGSREYEAQVQQRPAAAGGVIFKRAWWKRYQDTRELPTVWDREIISVDCAFKDADGSDYVAIHVWARKADRAYLLARVHERLSFTRTLAEVKAMIEWYPRATVHVEDKANGPAVIDALQQATARVLPVEPEGGKVARAYACQADVEHGRVWLPSAEIMSGITEFLAEASSFPSAPNDDDVDAFTQAMAILRFELREAASKKVGDGDPDRHPGFDPETHRRLNPQKPADTWQTGGGHLPVKPRISPRGGWDR